MPGVAAMRVVAVVPHMSGFISMVGSGWIIYEIALDEKKRAAVYHRFVLVASVGEFVVAMWLAMSSWVMPVGSFAFARGNMGSCNSQGFFLQLSSMSPLYTGAITLYYLLTARYGWKEHDFYLFERSAHALIILFGVVLASLGVCLQLYHPKGQWCWIETPPDSKSSSTAYMWTMTLFWMWLGIGMSLTCLGLLYHSVHVIEQKAQNYTISNQITAAKRRSLISSTATDSVALAAAAAAASLSNNGNNSHHGVHAGSNNNSQHGCHVGNKNISHHGDVVGYNLSSLSPPQERRRSSRLLAATRFRRGSLFSTTSEPTTTTNPTGVSSATTTNTQNKKSRIKKVGSSEHVWSISLDYVVGFAVPFLPLTVLYTVRDTIIRANPSQSPYDSPDGDSFISTMDVIVFLVVGLTFPLQGLFRFIIYMRPRYEKYLREHPNWSPRKIVWSVLQRAWKRNVEDDDHELGTTLVGDYRGNSPLAKKRGIKHANPDGPRPINNTNPDRRHKQPFTRSSMMQALAMSEPSQRSTEVKAPPKYSTEVKALPDCSTNVKPPLDCSTEVKPPPNRSTEVKPPSQRGILLKTYHGRGSARQMVQFQTNNTYHGKSQRVLFDLPDNQSIEEHDDEDHLEHHRRTKPRRSKNSLLLEMRPRWSSQRDGITDSKNLEPKPITASTLHGVPGHYRRRSTGSPDLFSINKVNEFNTANAVRPSKKLVMDLNDYIPSPALAESVDAHDPLPPPPPAFVFGRSASQLQNGLFLNDSSSSSASGSFVFSGQPSARAGNFKQEPYPPGIAPISPYMHKHKQRDSFSHSPLSISSNRPRSSSLTSYVPSRTHLQMYDDLELDLGVAVAAVIQEASLELPSPAISDDDKRRRRKRLLSRSDSGSTFFSHLAPSWLFGSVSSTLRRSQNSLSSMDHSHHHANVNINLNATTKQLEFDDTSDRVDEDEHVIDDAGNVNVDVDENDNFETIDQAHDSAIDQDHENDIDQDHDSAIYQDQGHDDVINDLEIGLPNQHVQADCTDNINDSTVAHIDNPMPDIQQQSPTPTTSNGDYLEDSKLE